MKIISGGQTGVDLGALDGAIELSKTHAVAWGGTAPKGMYNEAGKIDPKYALVEAKVSGYPFRTEQNVKDAHVTCILADGPNLGPGSKLTEKFCILHKKPYHIIDMGFPGSLPYVAGLMMGYIGRYGITNLVVNFAGGRESKNPGIQQKTRDFLIQALTTQVSDYPPVLKKE